MGAHGAVGGVYGISDGEVQSEIATQTDELSDLARQMLARDEQSLEHLAEADLAYLEMVRTKAGLHHQTAGALATSEAEQALADSWQKLIMLRLRSQKLQLRQQAHPMSSGDMARVEAELMRETTRIASKLQADLQQLTSAPRPTPRRRSAAARRRERSGSEGGAVGGGAAAGGAGGGGAGGGGGGKRGRHRRRGRRRRGQQRAGRGKTPTRPAAARLRAPP